MDDKLKYRIKGASRGNWKAILQEVTGLSPKKFKNIHQPCPLCKDGTDRYRFDDKGGSGGYYCNVCGPGNGVLFLTKFLKKSETDVYLLLDELLGITGGKPKILLEKYDDKEKKPDVRVLVPASRQAPKPRFWHFELGEPVKVWEYRNSFGDICFYIARFDKEGGGKAVIPMSYCHYLDVRSGEMRYGWRWKGVKRESGFKRPLYNLAVLLNMEMKKKWVLLVEGEKACDAAERMFPELCVVTWSGGTKSIDMTDWSPLLDRNIIIWPDNDADGFSAAIKLYGMFLEYNNQRNIKFAVAGSHRPKGWDVADAEDEGMDVQKLKQFLAQGTFSGLYSKLDA